MAKRKKVSKKRPVKPKMGKKQLALIAAVKANPSGTLEEWGIQAGYKGFPRQHAYRALQSDVIQAELEKIRNMMDARKALATKGLLDKLEDLLEAQNVIYVGKAGKRRVVPDNTTQRQSLELAFRVRHLLHTTNIQVTNNQTVFQKFEAQGMIFTDKQLAEIATGRKVPADFIPKGMELQELESAGPE